MSRNSVSGGIFGPGKEPVLTEEELAARAITIVADIVSRASHLINNVSYAIRSSVNNILQQGRRLSSYSRPDAGKNRSRDLADSLVSAAGIICPDLELDGHLDRVGIVGYHIAEEMGFDNSAKNRIRLGGRLHDIGKLDEEMHYIVGVNGVPSSRKKPRIKLHPTIGARVAEYFEFPRDVMDLILKHHFRTDGSGYPMQNGATMSAEVGILGVADALDSMIKPRPGKEIKNIPEALQEIRDGSGGHFHPDAVQALSRVAIQSIYR